MPNRRSIAKERVEDNDVCRWAFDRTEPCSFSTHRAKSTCITLLVLIKSTHLIPTIRPLHHKSLIPRSISIRMNLRLLDILPARLLPLRTNPKPRIPIPQLLKRQLIVARKRCLRRSCQQYILIIRSNQNHPQPEHPTENELTISCGIPNGNSSPRSVCHK
jgi:hypothetical protein